MIEHIKRRLIDDWRSSLHLWSVRLNALGLALMAWIQIDPVSILGVWNMLPVHTDRHLPPGAVAVIGGVLFALAMISRLVRQPKLDAKRQAKALARMQTDG
jgi:hypothetical protein